MHHLEQEFANAIGFVIDTSVNPPKRLGLAFLVSKSRVVCCASQVFHYVEAPWALAVKFPFPDIQVSIKTVNLHNDFDKVEARARYLNQTGGPLDPPNSFMNDIAMMVIEGNPPQVPQERIAELNRAMSLPFSSEGVEASGNMRGAEFIQVIKTIVESQREGLLTLYDGRNVPVAHLLMANGGILKVFFKQVMSSEMAFCELVYKQPALGFAFRPGMNIEWGDVPDVQTPPEALAYEAMRRAEEIPNLFQQLGGPDSRYQQVVQQFNPGDASEEIQWMVEPLWESLDGYITLKDMPTKIGVDTYTVLVAIRELVNRGVVSQINKVTPFPCTGQMGAPLVSHTDFEVHPWDALQAFYLDPISGRPTWLEGNFFGVANSLEPKNMLHTITIPDDIHGALILKDYKLIGIHSGEQIIKPGQQAPPVKCYQFMWMGALLDLSTRKVKSSTDTDDGEGVGSLRTLDPSKVVDQEISEEDLIKCPNCFAANDEYGECKTCGHKIEPPPKEEEPSNPILASKPAKEIRKLQKKYKVSNQQMIMGFGAVFTVSLLGLALCAPRGQAPANLPKPETKIVKAEPSDKEAVEIATEYAGFSATPPPMYWYKDTGNITAPSKSFGLFSEQSNQRILFIIYNDTTPINSLDKFVGKPPHVEVDRVDLSNAVVDAGEQILGSGKLKWILGKYTSPGKEGPVNILLAAFPAAQEGKSVLVVGQAFKDPDKRKYDFKTTLFVLDQLASELTARGNEEKLKTNEPNQVFIHSDDDEEDIDTDKTIVKVSSDEDIEKFLESAKEVIDKKLDLPEGFVKSAEKYEEEKGEPKKWKEVSLTVGLDRSGRVKRLEKHVDEAKFEKISKALENAIINIGQFDGAPVTKKPEFKFKVRLLGSKVDLKEE